MTILLKDGVRYVSHKYAQESELQDLVEQNVEWIFGESAVFLPGSKIGSPRGQKGAKGIPDGFVILIEQKKWAIIEVELVSHPIHDHIVAQVSRFSQAWRKGDTSKELANHFFQKCKNSKLIQSKFDKFGVKEEVFEFLTSLLRQDPLLVVIIDEMTPELEDVKESFLKYQTTWSIFKTFRREGLSDIVPIYQFDPLYDVAMGNTEKTPKQSITRSLTEDSNEVAIENRKLFFLDKMVPFRHSKQIPEIVANELIFRGELDNKHVPWGPGKKRYLVSKTPTHASGKDFFSPVQLSNGWWVETHASEEQNISLASRLIKWCGHEDSEIRVDKSS